MNKAKPVVTEHFPEWSLLATWVVVAESGSVSTAARLLHISQAAASQRIKLLETVLGIELLDRSTRPARPTLAGERLLQHAGRLLAQADEMLESIRNLSRSKRSIVRLGFVDSFAGTLGPALIHALSGESRQIRLWAGLTPLLDEQLENRQLDLAVTTTATSSKTGIKKIKLFSEAYLLALPKDLAIGTCTTLQDLGQRLQFIRYSARSVIGNEIDQYLDSMGETLDRTYELDNSDSLLSLVSARLGFALTTPLCLWQARNFLPELQLLPLSALQGTYKKHDTPPHRTFYLAYRENELGRLPNEASQAIEIAVKQLMEKKIVPAIGFGAMELWKQGEAHQRL